VFCEECGAALEAPCPACGAGNRPVAKFCRKCRTPLNGAVLTAPEPSAEIGKRFADKILASRSALEGERKLVTVLFADVKGSMELADQVDPEQWSAIMKRFFAILAEGVERFEGYVDKFTGDGIMALFGAPIAHEDHARRVCYAARMEQIAEPGKVYITAHTARELQGYFALADLGEMQIKGVHGAVQVHELQGLGRMHTRMDVSRSRGFSRCVGRGDEMQMLEAALARSREGNGQVVGVVADAGVGKSRLCYEFLQRCRARGLMTLETAGVSPGKAIPFLPILRLFRAFFGISEHDSDATARERIAGRLLLLDERLHDGLPQVFAFMGVPDPEHPAPHIDPEARQRQLFDIVRRVNQARSEKEMTVSLLEDLHWFDGDSAAFLEPVLDATVGSRGLVILNFRPEYHAAWMSRSNYQQLALAPLSADAVRELLATLLGSDPSIAGLAATIHARTAGNPFFVEEVVQSLVESGKLQGGLDAIDRVAALCAGDPQIHRDVVGFSPLIWTDTVSARVLAKAGRFDECRQRLERGIRMAREHASQENLVWAFAAKCQLAYLARGTSVVPIADAVRAAGEGVEIAEAVGSRYAQILVSIVLGVAHFVQGSYDASDECLTAALARARREENVLDYESYALAVAADACLARADTVAAIAKAREGIEKADAGGCWFFAALARTVLADALVRAGEPDRTVAPVIAEARELVRKTGGNSLLPRLREAEARLAGRTDRALLHAGLREAADMYRTLGAPDPAERLAREIAAPG
jgi:class 3 adenylate cyclase